jgi:CDP-glucose 4,6-dehydratase
VPVRTSSTVGGLDWQGKRVLVTGASGFKGAWLCEVLLSLGAEVTGIAGHVANPVSSFSLFELNKKMTTLRADISVYQEAADVLNAVEPEAIFHLAAKAQVPVALRDPKRTFSVNVMGTLNILEACRVLGIGGRLLVVSTDHVFGNPKPEDVPTDGFVETAPVTFSGPYDTSKSAMELCVRSYYSNYRSELPAIGITRAANVFGYGDVATRRVIPNFLQSGFDRGEIPLRYRQNGRQFIDVADIVEGYIRAAAALNPDADEVETFHFAIQRYPESTDGRNFVRIHELAEVCRSLFRTAKVVETPDCQDWAPHENQEQALNCDATSNRLNWHPSTGLREGLVELKEWYDPRLESSRGDLIKGKSGNVVERLRAGN